MKTSLSPIGSKKPIIDPVRHHDIIAAATLKAKEGIKADFEKTVATWTHKPKWYVTRRGTDWYIGTTDDIYRFVNEGTVPHIIKPRYARALRFFRTGFKPKTRVGYIASYAGRAANKNLTYSLEVHHPGTKARSFSEKIAAKWREEFLKMCRQAIRDASTPR